jgi:hypothetical protein
MKKDKWKVAETIIELKGKFIDLTDFTYLHDIYDNIFSPKLLIKSARQVTKSTTLGNVMILSCLLKSFYSSLYTAPSEKQISEFSNTAIKPTLIRSKFAQKFINSKTLNNVTSREFSNGSRMKFLHIHNPIALENTRGTSVDEINYDEIQDIDLDTLPIVEQCASFSKYNYHRYTGTAKTLDNCIETLWLQSSQNVWVITCNGCKKQISMEDGETVYGKMISKEGVRCPYCQTVIEYSAIINGRWESLKPNDFFKGYHVPKIISCINLTKKGWDRLWDNYKTYSKTKFMNEALGYSCDSGGKPITITEVKNICLLGSFEILKKQSYQYKISGIDWGISSSKSFTVHTILGLGANNRIDVIYAKKYVETEILEQVDNIIKTMRDYHVYIGGGDFGAGHTNNNLIKSIWCPNQKQKYVEYMYTYGKFYLYWDTIKEKYMLNRTLSLDSLIMAIKFKQILFPKYADIAPFCDDIMSLYEDVTNSGIKVYKKNPVIPDDFAHALNFAFVTANRLLGKIPIEQANTKRDTTLFEYQQEFALQAKLS